MSREDLALICWKLDLLAESSKSVCAPATAGKSNDAPANTAAWTALSRSLVPNMFAFPIQCADWFSVNCARGCINKVRAALRKVCKFKFGLELRTYGSGLEELTFVLQA